MIQLARIYAPLEKSFYHRWIYLFACHHEQCVKSESSFRCFRIMVPDSESMEKIDKKKKKAPHLLQSCFSGDFDQKAISLDALSSMVDQMELSKKPLGKIVEASRIKENSTKIQCHMISKSPSEFRVFVKEVNLEYRAESGLKNEDRELAHAKQLLKEYEKQNSLVASEIASEKEWAGEKYEKPSKIYEKTKCFRKFQRYLLNEPGQLLRYDFGGSPLFYDHDAVFRELKGNGPGYCSYCGKERIFELQIMPTALSLIEFMSQSPNGKIEEIAGNTLEWGTILIFSCPDNCDALGPKYYGSKINFKTSEAIIVEEKVRVQFEL